MLSALVAAFCVFTPPEGWKMSDPLTPSRHAICGFIDQSRSGFCPSIHLTQETITCSPDEYLRQIEKNAQNRKQKWRNIGQVATSSGKAQLIQLELKAPVGKVGLMQAILFKGDEVHILTAGALKRDLARLSPLFQKVFASMEILDDLFEKTEDPISLRAAWQKRGEDLESFQQKVMEQKKLGPVEKIQLMRLQ